MTGVVISSGAVLTPGVDGLDNNSPLVGYHNVVTESNVTATTEDPDFPAANLANPSTHLRWRSGAGSPSTEEYITVDLAGEDSPDIDYVAIARHNFGSSQAVISVEGATEEGSPESWVELVSERLLPDDGPALFKFTKQSLFGLRLRIQESQAATPATPYLGVIYVGALLYLQRRIYVGHTPQKYGRKIQVANQMSWDGEFLGRIVLSRRTATTVEVKNLTPDWYRSYMDPFIAAAQEKPFFFAWRPGDYPYEVGYAWVVNDPQPSNQLPNGMMQISLDVEGIAP